MNKYFEKEIFWGE